MMPFTAVNEVNRFQNCAIAHLTDRVYCAFYASSSLITSAKEVM